MADSQVLFPTLNRDHTLLKLVAWNPLNSLLSRVDSTEGTVLEESDPAWVNESYLAAPVPLPGGQGFLWLSERDGFMHLYRVQPGQNPQQLTKGKWLIDTVAWNLLTPGKPVHLDPSGRWAYFSTTEKSPLERQLVRLDLSSGQLLPLTSAPGFHFASLSADGQYLAEQFSNIDTPPIFSILKTDGSLYSVLGRWGGPSLTLPRVQRDTIKVKAHDGTELYAQLVKPENFNPNLRYPAIVHWYGGPTLQMVTNQYGSTSLFNPIERDTLYTQAGFLVWRLDNRGSFGRGHAFETPILNELGKAALDDQLAGVEYLKTLPYVDPTRIGTDGKSFGGYLTLYALIHAPGVFRCGVAGSGPTDWRMYDTIYTERYMRTPEENPAGYAATNLVAQAASISARPLIIHGLADTNVHIQNSINFVQALEAADKLFDFLPLPNLNHHYGGDGLAACLEASVDFFTRNFSGR
jgi:dipeptidyl-peptidase-4